MDDESYHKKRHHHAKHGHGHAHFDENQDHSHSSSDSIHHEREHHHQHRPSHHEGHGAGGHGHHHEHDPSGAGGHGHTGHSGKSPRKSIKRRVAETHILGKDSHDRTLSFSALQAHHHSKEDSLFIPSVNPVRNSIIRGSNQSHELVVHYNRYLHSHQTVDSRHELFYKTHGLPRMPRYNKSGRRFTDSSDTDPDYDPKEFKKLSEELNAAKEDSSDDDDWAEDELDHGSNSQHSHGSHHRHHQHGPKGNNKVHPESSKDKGEKCNFFSMLCCCCSKKEPEPTGAPAPAAPPNP